MRCLEEAPISSADDVDATSVLGLGFPRLLAGIASWVEPFGVNEFIELAASLLALQGEWFAPSAWLRGLARDIVEISKDGE